MVRLLKDNFSLLLAKRNITRNKKTSLVIIITLSLVFAIFMLMLGIKSIYKDIFTLEAKDDYPNIDIVISYDEYSDARLVNKRFIDGDYPEVEALAFFNLQVLSEVEEEYFYSKIFAASNSDFEIFFNKRINLNQNEIIITNTYAKRFDLVIGDNINIVVNNQELDLIIKDILDETGVFSQNSILINKAYILDYFYGLSSLDNIGNTIYIKSTNPEVTYERLKTDTNYENYLIRYTVDEERIEALIQEYISMILLVAIVVLLSLIFVLNSLFLIVLRDVFQEVDVVKTLGGTKRFGIKIVFYQWLFYGIISFFIGVFLAHIIIYVGASFYGVKEIIIVDPLIIISSTTVLTVLIIFRNLMYLRRYDKKRLTKFSSSLVSTEKIRFIIFIFSILILLLVGLFKPFNYQIQALIITVFTFVLALITIKYLVRISIRIFKRRKSSFVIYNLKQLSENKNAQQSLNVIFITFMVLMIMLTARMFFVNELENFKSFNNYDLQIVNINDYSDDLINDLKLEADYADPAIMFDGIYLNDIDEKKVFIKSFYSISYDDVEEYIDFDLMIENTDYLTDELPFIMVSKNYKYTYGLEEGQIITIDLSPEIKNQKFILAGFIDIEYEHFVYSNLADIHDEVGLNYNSIVIKDDAPNILMSNLIQQYSSKMYYIIDVNEYLNQEIVLSENILMLFTVILIFVILSYLLVIFNNTTLRFYAAKKDLMKIKVLGQSSKAFLKDGLKEYLLILIILTLVGIIVTLIFSEYFRYLLLFFNYYKHLTANISSVIIALILIYLSSFLSVIYYNRLIKNARISDTIKMY